MTITYRDHAFISTLVVLIAVGLHPVLGQGSGGISEAQVVAEALLAQDNSLRSLDWTQEVQSLDDESAWNQLSVDSNAFKAMVGNDAKWITTWDGRQVFDHRNRWFCDCRIGTRVSQRGPVDHYLHAKFAFDGKVMRTLNIEARAGFVRPPEAEVRSILSPRMLLGRYCDWEGGLRLGELLLKATELHILSASDDEVVLEGEVEVGSKWRIYNVTVNRQYGWMPTRIRTYDAIYGMLKEELVVTRAVAVDGVWVPVEGYRNGFVVDESALVAGVDEKIQTALIKLGLTEEPDFSKADERARLRQAVAAACPDGFPTRPIGDGTQRLVVTSINAVNEDVPDQQFVLEQPPGTVISDRLKDKIYEVQESDD